MTYYKAVRLDGTDFHSGTVRWLPKRRSERMRPRVVRHPTSTVAVKGQHGTSLAVSTDVTRLPGSSWPLRLCEVEPVPGAPVIGTDEHKRQAVAWRVVREVDPWLRFGTQGEYVAALIDRARLLAPDEARALVAARVAAWDALALVVRHLIGAHGLTQAHYDVLTRAWRTAIGPIHPDDAPMGGAA